MQKVNKSSVKKGAALCLAMAMACTAFVGCGKKDDAASASGATSESAVEVLDNSKLTEMPDGVSLSEDQMKTTMNAYAAYMTEALASDGYTVTVRYDDGSTVEVPDLSKFDNLSAAFAYLYNCGQADAEGNLLVATSVPAEEAAASEAESTAESEAADSEASDSEAESTETDGDAAESTEEASSEDTAEADSAAESEAPADETAVG